MGFEGGDVNLFVYCLNDPVNLIDPEGLSHIGFIKQLAKMADKGVKSTIKSLNKRIGKHEKSLADPSQSLAKKHHEHELRVFNGQLKLAEKEAKKRGLMSIVALMGSLLDPFDAISGELASDEEYLQQYYENNQNSCK